VLLSVGSRVPAEGAAAGEVPDVALLPPPGGGVLHGGDVGDGGDGGEPARGEPLQGHHPQLPALARRCTIGLRGSTWNTAAQLGRQEWSSRLASR
jgi:hypothetical protein